MQHLAPDGCTMSRRKQAKPQHIDSEDPASLGNGEFYAPHMRVLLPQIYPVSPRHAVLRTGDIFSKV